MILVRMALGILDLITTLSMTSLIVMTLRATTFRITTVSIMALGTVGLIVVHSAYESHRNKMTLSNDTRHI